MKKHYLYGCLAICLVVFGWAILGLGSSHALAQATEETPGAVM